MEYCFFCFDRYFCASLSMSKFFRLWTICPWLRSSIPRPASRQLLLHQRPHLSDPTASQTPKVVCLQGILPLSPSPVRPFLLQYLCSLTDRFSSLPLSLSWRSPFMWKNCRSSSIATSPKVPRGWSVCASKIWRAILPKIIHSYLKCSWLCVHCWWKTSWIRTPILNTNTWWSLTEPPSLHPSLLKSTSPKAAHQGPTLSPLTCPAPFLPT